MPTSVETGTDFGARMRRAREARGVTLRQIADTTKLSMAALEALERNDISKLPGGIFSRAFVRSYAAEVGMDPEATVREFLNHVPRDSMSAGSPHIGGLDGERTADSRRRAALVAMGCILALLIVGGLMLAIPAG